MSKRLTIRILLSLLGFVSLSAIAAAVWTWIVLQGSVAQTEGQRRLPGLASKVEVNRDVAGVPTIVAGNRLDLARALGFVHGQERFFQMDTIRRSGSGELSELAGSAALPIDRLRRRHRFRARAQTLLAQMPNEHRALIGAYTEGVNEGLRALDRPPFEYTILRTDPHPWLPEDTLLCIYAMYFELQESDAWVQRRRALAEKALGPAMAEFLYANTEGDDAALDGSVLPEPPIPTQPAAQTSVVPAPPPAPPNGSNAFAVAAKRSAGGRAIVASDMHLPIRVPDIWYRARLQVRQGNEATLDLNGVTLPGVPLLVSGSNGKVAWGFTDAYVETGDAIRVDPVPGDAQSYLTPSGPARIEVVTERLCPARQPCEDLAVENTIWGPVVARETDGTRIVWRWSAHDLNAIDFHGLLGFESASTVREAFDAAHRAGLPQQNLIVADSDGHIGWTIIGPVPRRFGLNGMPQSWADGSRGWKGYLSPGEIPEIVDPQEGVVWTANNRMVGGTAFDILGDSGYASPARAQKIRDDLRSKETFAERDLLAIQLDVRTPSLEPWQKLLEQLLASRTEPEASRMVSYVRAWGAAAAMDSVGYRLVRSFEEQSTALIYSGFGGPIQSLAGPRAGTVQSRSARRSSLRLMMAQPRALVPPPFSSWDAVRDALYAGLVRRVREEAGGDLTRFTWGAKNRTGIHHPLAVAVPALGWLLDPPDEALPGDVIVPRASSPGYGASERFVVSPGHESEGIFELPVGEASNPLSPYFLAGHEDWVRGNAAPFLPGAVRWKLVLTP